MSTTTVDHNTADPQTDTAAEPELAERLRSEADFQNRRVLSEDGEVRDRFLYLVEDGFDRYYDEMDSLRDQDVLVVGCSSDGIPAQVLHRNRATGIDISDEAIAWLNGWIRDHGLEGQSRALVMNAEDLDVPERSLDVLLCSGVLHHLHIEAAARSWSRVIREDGRVLMLEPMAWNPAIALFRFLTPSMRTPDEHPLVPKDIRTLRRWFGKVRVEAYALLTLLSLIFAFVPDPLGLKERIEKILRPVDRALFRVFPFLKYFAWTVHITCTEPRDIDAG